MSMIATTIIISSSENPRLSLRTVNVQVFFMNDMPPVAPSQPRVNAEPPTGWSLCVNLFSAGNDRQDYGRSRFQPRPGYQSKLIETPKMPAWWPFRPNLNQDPRNATRRPPQLLAGHRLRATLTGPNDSNHRPAFRRDLRIGITPPQSSSARNRALQTGGPSAELSKSGT